MATSVKKPDSAAEANGTVSVPNGNKPEAVETHPWASSAGVFADDPFWDEMMESIARHRREMDAEYQATE